MSAAAELLLDVRDARRVYPRRGGGEHVALAGVSFALREGETIAVVGESGAGKSTLARIVAGLDRPTSGSVALRGEPLRIRPGVRSPVQMVFQDPHDALSPYLPVGVSVGEPIRDSRAARRRRVAELLERVGVDPTRADQRPSAFSGGQLQRIVLARALAADPAVLLCDEPTSALDVSVQAQIVNLLLDVQDESRFAYVLVTHDLGVARIMADEVIVLCDGQVEEQGPAEAFFAGPSSVYGRRLLAASDEGGPAPGADPAAYSHPISWRSTATP